LYRQIRQEVKRSIVRLRWASLATLVGETECCPHNYYVKEEQMGGSAKKWRKKKMSKHKHRKRLKKTRWQRRQK